MRRGRMEITHKNNKLMVALSGSLDLVMAGDLRDLMLEALSQDSIGGVILQGAAVEHVSTACIQVVLSAAQSLRTGGRSLEIESPSVFLAESFRRLGLQDDFNALAAC